MHANHLAVQRLIPAEHQSWPALAVLLGDGVDVVVEPPLKQEVILGGSIALDMGCELAGPQLISILPQTQGWHRQPPGDLWPKHTQGWSVRQDAKL